MSVANQSTRASKRKGGKNLEEELKRAMPKGWNIREGFEVRDVSLARNSVLVLAYGTLITTITCNTPLLPSLL